VLTIACVLRSGPEFRPQHVFALARGVRRHLKLPHRFVCLTDLISEVEAGGVDAIELPDKWPGWWAKICLFRPGLIETPAIYLDLDTLVVSRIDDLVLGHNLTVLGPFGNYNHIGSGLLAWDCDLSAVYNEFRGKPDHYMGIYSTKKLWGDQDFLHNFSPVSMDYWQDKFPGRVVHYMMHCRNQRFPRGASIVCYGGNPRPWKTSLAMRVWAKQHNSVMRAAF
jgi:hypothetical protein